VICDHGVQAYLTHKDIMEYIANMSYRIVGYGCPRCIRRELAYMIPGRPRRTPDEIDEAWESMRLCKGP